MRAVLRLAALIGIAAAPALAQPPPLLPAPGAPNLPLQGQINMLHAQQDLAARQAASQRNDLSRLDAQMRTEQNLASLRAFSAPPPAPPWTTGPIPNLDAGTLVSIPDAALAASNARVRAAAADQP